MELSVIIPVLNEAGTLPGLFRNLAAQLDVALEVIVCDGGSDGRHTGTGGAPRRGTALSRPGDVPPRPVAPGR